MRRWPNWWRWPRWWGHEGPDVGVLLGDHPREGGADHGVFQLSLDRGEITPCLLQLGPGSRDVLDSAACLDQIQVCLQGAHPCLTGEKRRAAGLERHPGDRPGAIELKIAAVGGVHGDLLGHGRLQIAPGLLNLLGPAAGLQLIQVRHRRGHRSLGPEQGAAQVAVIHPRQDLAGADLIPLIHSQCRNAPGLLRTDVHRCGGADRAGGCHLQDHLTALHRRGLSRQLGLPGLRLTLLPDQPAAAGQTQRDQHGRGDQPAGGRRAQRHLRLRRIIRWRRGGSQHWNRAQDGLELSGRLRGD